jgi:hypothetical protein
VAGQVGVLIRDACKSPGAQGKVGEDCPVDCGRDRVRLRSSAARRPSPAPNQMHTSTARNIGMLKRKAPNPIAISVPGALTAAVLCAKIRYPTFWAKLPGRITSQSHSALRVAPNTNPNASVAKTIIEPPPIAQTRVSWLGLSARKVIIDRGSHSPSRMIQPNVGSIDQIGKRLRRRICTHFSPSKRNRRSGEMAGFQSVPLHHHPPSGENVCGADNCPAATSLLN